MSSKGTHEDLLATLPSSSAPPMNQRLIKELDRMQPVKLRNPLREFWLFVAFSLPFFALLLLGIGIRRDLDSISLWWLGGVGGIWTIAFFISAYLGWVPPRTQVVRSPLTIRGTAAAFALLVIAIGLFATQPFDTGRTYPSTLENFFAHSASCSVVGVSAGLVPGLLALFLLRRYVPVGRGSFGLALGAAGGALVGLTLILHCPIAERFHAGLIHGGTIATSALIVGAASRYVLARKD